MVNEMDGDLHQGISVHILIIYFLSEKIIKLRVYLNTCDHHV